MGFVGLRKVLLGCEGRAELGHGVVLQTLFLQGIAEVEVGPWEILPEPKGRAIFGNGFIRTMGEGIGDIEVGLGLILGVLESLVVFPIGLFNLPQFTPDNTNVVAAIGRFCFSRAWLIVFQCLTPVRLCFLMPALAIQEMGQFVVVSGQ